MHGASVLVPRLGSVHLEAVGVGGCGAGPLPPPPSEPQAKPMATPQTEPQLRAPQLGLGRVPRVPGGPPVSQKLVAPVRKTQCFLDAAEEVSKPNLINHGLGREGG